MTTGRLVLAVEADGTGAHPAAWRYPGASATALDPRSIPPATWLACQDPTTQRSGTYSACRDPSTASPTRPEPPTPPEPPIP
jgi:hypothetical protein